MFVNAHNAEQPAKTAQQAALPPQPPHEVMGHMSSWGPRGACTCKTVFDIYYSYRDIVRFRKNVPFGDLSREISCC